MVKYCECGCGAIVKDNRRFVQGHNTRLMTLETKRNISQSVTEQHKIHREEGKSYGFKCGDKHPMKNSELAKQAGEKKKGKHPSPETEFKEGSVPHNKGEKMSIGTRKKQSETRLKNFKSGKVSKINKGSFEEGKTYEEKYGEIKGKEKRLKLRLRKIKYVEQQRSDGSPLYPTVGRYEKSIIDNLEQCFGYNVERQKRVAGYFLDGYCPMLKLAIEVDEPRHEKLIKQDSRRQNEIEEELGCTFLRIKVPKHMEV